MGEGSGKRSIENGHLMGGRPARLCRFPCCPGRGTHNPTPGNPGHMLLAGLALCSQNHGSAGSQLPVFRSCTGAAGNSGHCGHWSGHGRPQPLTLFLLSVFHGLFLSEMHTGPEGSWRLPWGQAVPRCPHRILQRRLLLTRSPTPWSLRLSCLLSCHLP